MKLQKISKWIATSMVGAMCVAQLFSPIASALTPPLKKPTLIKKIIPSINLKKTVAVGQMILTSQVLSSLMGNQNKIQMDPQYGDWLGVLQNIQWKLNVPNLSVPADRKVTINGSAYPVRSYLGGLFFSTEQVMWFSNASTVLFKEHNKPIVSGLYMYHKKSDVERTFGSLGYRLSNFSDSHAIYVFPKQILFFYYDSTGSIRQVSAFQQNGSNVLKKIEDDVLRYKTNDVVTKTMPTKTRAIIDGRLYINNNGQLTEKSIPGKSIVQELPLNQFKTALLTSDSSIYVMDEQKMSSCEWGQDARSCLADLFLIKSQKKIEKIESDESKNWIIAKMAGGQQFSINIPYSVSSLDMRQKWVVETGKVKVLKSSSSIDAAVKSEDGKPIALSGNFMFQTDCDAQLSYNYLCEPKNIQLFGNVDSNSIPQPIMKHVFQKLEVNYTKELLTKLWKENNRYGFTGTITFDALSINRYESKVYNENKLSGFASYISVSAPLSNAYGLTGNVVPTTPTMGTYPTVAAPGSTIPNTLPAPTVCVPTAAVTTNAYASNPFLAVTTPASTCSPTASSPFTPVANPTTPTSTVPSVGSPTMGNLTLPVPGTPNATVVSTATTNPLFLSLLQQNGQYTLQQSTSTVTLGGQYFAVQPYLGGLYLITESALLLPNQAMVFYPNHNKTIIGSLTMKSKLADFQAALGSPIQMPSVKDKHSLFTVSSPNVNYVLAYWDDLGNLTSLYMMKATTSSVNLNPEVERHQLDLEISTKGKTETLFAVGNAIYAKVEPTRFQDVTSSLSLPVGSVISSITMLDSKLALLIVNKRYGYTFDVSKLLSVPSVSSSALYRFQHPEDITSVTMDKAKNIFEIKSLNASYSMTMEGQSLVSANGLVNYGITSSVFEAGGINKIVVKPSFTTYVTGKLSKINDCGTTTGIYGCIKWKLVLTTDGKMVPVIGQANLDMELLLTDAEVAQLISSRMPIETVKDNVMLSFKEFHVYLNMTTKQSSMKGIINSIY